VCVTGVGSIMVEAMSERSGLPRAAPGSFQSTLGLRPFGSPLALGTTVMVAYEGEALWHERLLLRFVGSLPSLEFVILTPDEDMYIEDLLTVRYLPTGARRQRPAKIGSGKSYRFAEPFYNDVEMAELECEAGGLLMS
jgi:hypothetical protein